MPNVLVMSAVEFGYPVIFFVFIESGNFSFHFPPCYGYCSTFMIVRSPTPAPCLKTNSPPSQPAIARMTTPIAESTMGIFEFAPTICEPPVVRKYQLAAKINNAPALHPA